MSMLSWAKVENVVKPPQRPVVSSMHHGLFRAPFLANSAKSTPKARQPTRFTAKVPQGNPCPHTLFITAETRNLNPPPTKLPNPTINIDFSISFAFIYSPTPRIKENFKRLKTLQKYTLGKNFPTENALTKEYP